MPKRSFLDFFCGAGLVTEALRPFFRAVWANDICQRKAEVYTANHGERHFIPGPIQKVRGSTLPSAQLSWASFPCQDLSLAGNTNGIFSPRSGLVWEWLRVIDEMPQKPPVLAVENVAGLVSLKNGRDYKELHKAIVARHYKVGAFILNAINWVPQSRPRVFIVAVRDDIDISPFILKEPSWHHTKPLLKAVDGLKDWVWWSLPNPPQSKKSLADIIDFNQPLDEHRASDKNISLIPDTHLDKLLDMISSIKVAPGYKRIRKRKQVLELRFDGNAGCLRTPNGGSSRQFLVFKNNGSFGTRLLTVREAARLMGVRDSYKIPGNYNDGYRAMGDAVAVPPVRFLARHLLSPLVEAASEKS